MKKLIQTITDIRDNSALKEVERLKKEIIEKVKDQAKSGTKNITVISFRKKDFNEKLSTNVGIGFQDLNEQSQIITKWIMNEFNGKISFMPKVINALDVEIDVVVNF